MLQNYVLTDILAFPSPFIKFMPSTLGIITNLHTARIVSELIFSDALR